MLGGADQHDLARLAREMLDRAQTSPDRDSDGFEERALWLGTTFGGAGRLQGDLTPACAAALTVVLEALGQKAGPEDTRTAAQRRHDAIEEACRRLISGQMIPGRDGQPPHLNLHIDLGELRGQPGGSVLERSWTPAKAAAGPGSAYLTGLAAEAAACDAVLTTIVTGQIDWQVLDHLTTLWLTLHNQGHGHAGGDSHASDGACEAPATATPVTAPARPPATATPVTAPARPPATGRPPVTVTPATATARPGATATTTIRPPATAKPPGGGRCRRRPAPGCRPSSCKPASMWSPAPAGWPPTCAAPCSTPRTPVPASRWTSAAPPAPSPRTCTKPSSSGTGTASTPAAPSPPPCAKCTT